ncbi:MAG: TRAP transporter substrate-binding protein DctP [Desulfatibacillaceae bacterium]
MRSEATYTTLATAFLVLAILAGGLLAPPDGRADDNPTVFKFATLAPKNVGWSRHIENIVLPYIRKATEDHLRIKVYWGGIMGDDEDYLRKMRIGQLQGAGLSGQGVALLVPEMSVLQLPFMFRNYEEVDYVKERMTERFDRLLRDRGLFLIAWIDQDFDQTYSVHRPLGTLEDFRGARFHTWYGKVEEEVIEALGAMPVPVDVPEAPSAVRQGMFNVGMGPALWFVGAQMYSVFRYVNPMPLRYSPALVVANIEAWNSLSSRHQKNVLSDRQRLMRRFCDAVRKDNQKSLDAMCAYGLRRVEPGPRELEEFRKVTRPIWDELAGDLYSKELLEELISHLRDFREGGAGR